MTAPVTARVAAFDRLRGLIMVLMAIDHASFFIARVHPMESWAAPPPYYAGVAAFLTRWLTHLCAPGFFMLMGIGIVWFAESRRAAGWSSQRIAGFYVTRGAMLLVIQHFVENPAWLLGLLSVDPAEASLLEPPGVGGDVMLAFAVLSALGIAMILWGIAWRAPLWVILVVCVGAPWLTRVLVPDASAAAQPIPLWKVMLFVPGKGGIVQNMYPWVIWLVPAGVGVALGRVFLREPRSRIPSIASQAAIAGLAAFVVFRLTGLGEYHEPAAGLTGWLTVTKYPPSDAFFALMLGLDLALLAAMARWPARWMSVLEVYGRVPFFFYLAHLYAFGVLSWAFRSGTSRPVMYLVWAAVIAALYPACAAYARFKFSKPATSLWRLF